MEERIIKIVDQNDGILDLSLLKQKYLVMYNEPIPVRVRLSDWCDQFPSLSVSKKGNTNYIRSVVENKTIVRKEETETEKCIVSVLQRHGGSLWLSHLAHYYQREHNARLHNPNGGKLLPWIKSFASIVVSTHPKNKEKIISLKDKTSNQPNDSLNANVENSDQSGIMKAIITSQAELQTFLLRFEDDLTISLDCEVLENESFLLVLRNSKACCAIDCQSIGLETVGLQTKKLMHGGKTIFLHDFYHLNPYLDRLGLRTEEFFKDCIDTQLVMELLTQDTHSSFVDLSIFMKTSTCFRDRNYKQKNSHTHPLVLTNDCVKRAMDKVSVLHQTQRFMIEHLDSKQLDTIKRSSLERSRNEVRDIRFITDQNYRMVSYELAKHLHQRESISQPAMMKVHNEVESVLELLPIYIREELEKLGTEHITDVCLDIGRQPLCWWNNERKMVCCNKEKNFIQNIMASQRDFHVVDDSALKFITDKVGKFGFDNRGGIEKALHRISCIKNRTDKIIGLTIRFGRHVDGNADMIKDLLLGDNGGSILFLGEVRLMFASFFTLAKKDLCLISFPVYMEAWFW